jgi:hypothetical protein
MANRENRNDLPDERYVDLLEVLFMKFFRTFAGLLVLGLLAACQAVGTPGGSSATSYPVVMNTPRAAYSEPGTGGLSGGDYPMMPGDENKLASNFYAEKLELRANSSDSTQTDLFVSGSLPTPCHDIRAFVNPPDENKQIMVEVYSVTDPDKVCAQVLQPYEGVVTTFSDIPAGQYTIIVNGVVAGEIMVP